MEKKVLEKAKEFNKYYEEVMSKDSTADYLEKNLEVIARVEWAAGKKEIDLAFKKGIE